MPLYRLRHTFQRKIQTVAKSLVAGSVSGRPRKPTAFEYRFNAEPSPATSEGMSWEVRLRAAAVYRQRTAAGYDLLDAKVLYRFCSSSESAP